jgi:hypothetical protein
MCAKLIHEFVALAGLSTEFGDYTMHCLRRGGLQYFYIFAPIEERMSLPQVVWWAGWRSGMNVSGQNSDAVCLVPDLMPLVLTKIKVTLIVRYALNCQWAVQTSHGDFLCPALQPGISRVFTSGADLGARCPVTVEENRLRLNQLDGSISGLQSDVTELAGAVTRLPQLLEGAFTCALLSPVVTVLMCISFTPPQSSSHSLHRPICLFSPSSFPFRKKNWTSPKDLLDRRSNQSTDRASSTSVSTPGFGSHHSLNPLSNVSNQARQLYRTQPPTSLPFPLGRAATSSPAIPEKIQKGSKSPLPPPPEGAPLIPTIKDWQQNIKDWEVADPERLLLTPLRDWKEEWYTGEHKRRYGTKYSQRKVIPLEFINQ